MKYLDRSQEQILRENNKVLTGEFVRDQQRREVQSMREQVHQIKALIAPARYPRSVAHVVVKGLTGYDLERFIAFDGLGTIVRSSRRRRKIESAVKNLFRR